MKQQGKVQLSRICLAVCLAMASQTAQAQQTNTKAEAEGLEIIQVTAQQRLNR